MPAGDGTGSGSSSSDEEPNRPSLKDLADSVMDRTDGRDRPSRVPPVESGPPDEPDAEQEDREASDADHRDREVSEAEAGPVDDSRADAIVEVLGGQHESVLLLGPLREPVEYDLCARLITAIPDGTGNLLLVTTTESADERISVYQGYLDTFPERTTVLAVGDPGRSASTETVSVGEDRTVTIESINDATDLMRLGIVISKLTSEWDDAGGEAVLCFHSLTGLIGAALDVQSVFRFTHILLARLERAGIHVHFHMDPAEHDEETLDTFRALFDEVIAFDAGGAVEVLD